MIRSSHWQNGNHVAQLHSQFWMKPIQALERLSYWQVTSALPAYPEAWTTIKHIARRDRLDLTFDVWKCAVIYALLKRYLVGQRVLIIGDGFGVLARLISESLRPPWLGLIDLPEQLVCQRRHLRRSASFCEPQDVLSLPPFEVAINVASMQEMTKEMIGTYFYVMRKNKALFYCLNRLEKKLPGGEIVRFVDYHWSSKDFVLIDEKCPFYTHMLTPLPTRFDGEHWHRLALLTDL